MTKVELLYSDERYQNFLKLQKMRLKQKEHYPLNVPYEQVFMHLVRKFCETYLEFEHKNKIALKKELVDLANLSMLTYMVLEGFQEKGTRKRFLES